MGNNNSASKSAKQPKWMSLKSTPFGHFPSITVMDSKKILTVPLNNSFVKSDGIYTYIISQNKWIKSIKYDKNLWFSSIAVAFNKNTNKLYICRFVCNNLVIIDCTTFEWILISCPYLSNCDGAKCIIINNDLHLIGGKRNNKHLVWKPEAKHFEQVHVFQDLKVGFKSHKLVYIESKQILLMFGGESSQQPLDTIYVHSTVATAAPTAKWKTLGKVSMPKRLSNFGLVSVKINKSGDGVVCILFGGVIYDENGYHFSKDIFVFDVDNQLFSKSMIQCPISYMFEGIVYDNYPYSEVLITSGYVRNLRNINLPNDIISFMASLFIFQYVHLIDVKDGNHWKINVDDILSNTQLINVTVSTRYNNSKQK